MSYKVSIGITSVVVATSLNANQYVGAKSHRVDDASAELRGAEEAPLGLRAEREAVNSPRWSRWTLLK